MGFFRSAMDFFRGGARKHREERPAELLKEQAQTITAQPAVVGQEIKHEEIKHEEEMSGLLDEQAATITTQPAVATRGVKREARPNPNKPGWGLSVGPEAGKAREDGASQG